MTSYQWYQTGVMVYMVALYICTLQVTPNSLRERVKEFVVGQKTHHISARGVFEYECAYNIHFIHKDYI